ncbi:MAG: hypothetical protein JXO72_12005 [Vicinamibacteria bacterium]|nr:hypothetical protein [Vicinamibacteria bacterium]
MRCFHRARVPIIEGDGSTESDFVFYEVRDMRNATVSVDDALARWVRLETARRDTSVSRFLADLAKAQMRSDRRYQRALRSALARESFLKSEAAT